MVSKTLGGGNMEVQCFDGERRIGHIRGKMRKKVWINPGDLVLVSLRDFQEGKADIVLKYTPDEARSLKSLGEIPETTVINENEGPENTDIQFGFGAADEEGSGSESSAEELDIDDI